jgi:RHS repeat-associated protein
MTSGQYSKVTTVGIHGKPITISENNETVSYGYDPMGNLVYTNQAGLETVLEYDAFGRKSKQSDPSMGIWQYKHNAFGELIWQQDANGTVVEYGYDELGRKHSETTSGDAITWVFNSSGNGIGQLHSVSRSQDGVTRIYRYDALGRVDAETLNVSGKSYQVTYAYDAFSRQSTASYPDDIEIFRSYDSVGQVHSVEMPTEDYLDYNYEIVRTEFKAVIEERIKYENLVRTLSAQVAHHEAKWQAYLAKIKELEELKILAEGEVGDLESIAQQHGIIAAYYLGKVTETQTRLANSSNSRIGWQGIVDGKHYFRRKWCSSRNVFGCRKRKERKDWFEVGELNLWHTMDVAGEIKSQYKDSVQWVQEFHKRGRWAPTVVVQRVLNLWNGLHTRALKNQALAQAKIDSPAATSRIYVEEPYTEDSWVIIANGSINIPIPVVLDKVRMVWKSVTVDEEIEHYETEIPKYQTLAANEKLVRDNKNVELTEGRTDLITASQTEEAFEKSFGFESIDEVDGVISERQNLESEHDRLVVWMALARNSAGQLQSELFGNGVVTWREFDDHDLSLTQIKSGTYSGYTLRQLEYDYDSQGRIVSKEDTQNGSQQFEIYEYDDQDRIDYWSFAQTKGDGATYTTQRSYDYDDHGNIIYKSNAGYMDIDSYSNRLTSRTHNSVTSQYHYDGNGNMKSGDGRNYTWNYFNKIAQVSKGGASVAYSYDGFGNRASQVNEAGDRTYYVGSGYEVTVQQAGSSTIELHRHNILVGDDVVATYERRIEDGEHDKDQAAYYHRDIIGSGDIVTSSNMSIISQRFYSPYGEEISLTVGEQQYANDQQLQIYKDEIVKVETVKKDQLLEQLIGLKVSHAPGLYPQQRSSTKCNWLGNCTTRRTFVFPQLTREYLNSMPFQQWDRIYLQSNTYLHVDIRGLINEWHDLKRVLQDYEVELKRTVGNDNSANVEAIDDGYIDEVRREVSMDDDATLVSEALTRNGGFAGTLRGYTSHEELRSIGLVNMNARHYDAFTGRFISADTMIPEADKPASYNRYAYVYGNPISMRDPSGHFSISLADTASVIGMSAHIFFNGLISLPYMFDSPQLQLAATVAYSAVGGAAMSGALVTNGLVASKTVAVMISAGTVSLGMSAAQSGKIDGVAVRNAAWAAASAGASYEIGHGLGKNWQDPTQYLAHGTVQGAISWAQGGSFIQGAVAGLAGHATGDLVGGYGGNNPAHIAARTTIAASLGYLSAEATGGDGARAAIAAASVHLYNYEGAQKDAKPSLVKGVKVYRKDIDIGGEDKYGHWWIEIDGKESYGWWPKEPVDLKGTLLGVDGELNGQTNFGGTATLDPHHGDRSSGVNVFDVYSTQPRDTVIQSIRSFSNSYSGSWSWPIGQNCHSFQDALLDNHGMTIRSAP